MTSKRRSAARDPEAQMRTKLAYPRNSAQDRLLTIVLCHSLVSWSRPIHDEASDIVPEAADRA